jgi:predicted class III extradiol MEMO1 family dioxygenase
LSDIYPGDFYFCKSWLQGQGGSDISEAKGRQLIDTVGFAQYAWQMDGNYKAYKWTWCGRYSVPVTLYASYYLNNSKPLSGELIGYSTSISSEHVSVDDIGMGRTAIAIDCHWVGYPAIGYR